MDMMEQHRQMRQRLMRENVDAPADRIIRKLFELGAVKVVDAEDGEKLGSPEETLDLWYGLDVMDLSFELHGRRGWIQLVHQSSRPHIDDVSDYSAWLDGVDGLGELLTDESCYRSIFTQ